MFDHHDGIASLDQCVQLQQQAVHVGRMQARRRFVQYVQGMAALGTLQLGGKFDALSFTP